VGVKINAQTIIDGKKKCSKCVEWLPVSAFHKKKGQRSGLSCSCRQCVASYRPLKATSEFEIIIDGKKKCAKCFALLSVSEFYKKRSASSGLQRLCKQCKAVERSQPESRERDRIYRATPEYKERQTAYYQKNKERLQGLARLPKNVEKRRIAAALPEAKAKKKKYNAERMARPGVKERRRKWLAEYYRKTKVRRGLKEYFARHYARPDVKIRVAKYYRERKQADPKLKLNSITSTAIYQSLKRRGGGKNGSHWETLVGYTIDDLKKHLEKQFTGGMTWDNYGRGGWNIDHIIPISKWNFTSPAHDDFNKCWELKNLQPLWEVENIRKSNKLEKPFQPSLQLAVT